VIGCVEAVVGPADGVTTDGIGGGFHGFEGTDGVIGGIYDPMQPEVILAKTKD